MRPLKVSYNQRLHVPDGTHREDGRIGRGYRRLPGNPDGGRLFGYPDGIRSAAIWGGRIVSDSTLVSRINAARRAIGDDGEQQRLIRTVSRKGIRFVATVRDVSDSTGSRSAGMDLPMSPNAPDPMPPLNRQLSGPRGSQA